MPLPSVRIESAASRCYTTALAAWSAACPCPPSLRSTADNGRRHALAERTHRECPHWLRSVGLLLPSAAGAPRPAPAAVPYGHPPTAPVSGGSVIACGCGRWGAAPPVGFRQEWPGVCVTGYRWCVVGMSLGCRWDVGWRAGRLRVRRRLVISDKLPLVLPPPFHPWRSALPWAALSLRSVARLGELSPPPRPSAPFGRCSSIA